LGTNIRIQDQTVKTVFICVFERVLTHSCEALPHVADTSDNNQIKLQCVF
jgi:hypothetical protein